MFPSILWLCWQVEFIPLRGQGAGSAAGHGQALAQAAGPARQAGGIATQGVVDGRQQPVMITRAGMPTRSGQNGRRT